MKRPMYFLECVTLLFGLPIHLIFLIGLLLLTILEAYLAYGLDNLFLPLGGAMLYYASQSQSLF